MPEPHQSMKIRLNAAQIPLLTICGIGILIRLATYLGQRELWGDEIYIADNILNRTFSGLFSPLDSGQIAPIGWLAAVKATSLLAFQPEISLRVVPVLSGLVALICAIILFAKLSFLSMLEKLFASMCIAFLPVIIYYSSELKQYVTDLGTSAFLTLIYVRLCYLAKIRTHDYFVVLLSGMVSVILSFTACFVIFGCGLGLLYQLYKNRRSSEFYILVGVLLALAVFWLLQFFGLNSFAGQNAADMREKYWVREFAPFPPVSLRDLIWYYSRYFELFNFLFSYIGPLEIHGQGLLTGGVAGLLFIIGLARIYSREKFLFVMLSSILFVTIFASIMKLYPATSRLSLFLCIYLILGVACGLYALVSSLANYRIVGSICMGFIFLTPISGLISAMSRSHPFTHSGYREIIKYIEARYKVGDVIYVGESAVPQLRFYLSCSSMRNITMIRGLAARYDMNNYIMDPGTDYFKKDILALKNYKRVWLIFASQGSQLINNRMLAEFLVRDFASVALSHEIYRAPFFLINVAATATANASVAEYHATVPNGYRPWHPAFKLEGPRTLILNDDSRGRKGDGLRRGACG